MYKLYEQHLRTLQNGNKYRKLVLTRQESHSHFLDFSTNDYLNLSHHPKVIKAAQISAQDYGVGATGSRLFSGNLDLYENFERIIAKDKQSESSLIFNSGFQANISVLSSLLDEKILTEKPIVFFDKLNHASLYQAVFLSKAELCRYYHNDMNHLESLLIKYKNSNRPKFIVTETIFGMDGDIAPIEEIVNLANHYNAFLYFDEAHATGIVGVNGYGLSTMVDLQHTPHVIMGTFSKAIGASGGYIACHSSIRNFLVNKSIGFIYSTAPSPMVVGGAFAAWQLIKDLNDERKHLQNLSSTLRDRLQANGFDTGTSQTHIIPIILKEEKACLKAQELLLQENIIVSCVRPPSVPPGGSRLRIALTSAHQHQDLEKLLHILQKVFKS